MAGAARTAEPLPTRQVPARFRPRTIGKPNFGLTRQLCSRSTPFHSSFTSSASVPFRSDGRKLSRQAKASCAPADGRETSSGHGGCRLRLPIARESLLAGKTTSSNSREHGFRLFRLHARVANVAHTSRLSLHRPNPVLTGKCKISLTLRRQTSRRAGRSRPRWQVRLAPSRRRPCAPFWRRRVRFVVARLEARLNARDFVFEVEDASGTPDQTECLFHRFTHGFECVRNGIRRVSELWTGYSRAITEH